jgi:D-xylonolactonase
MAFKGRQTLSTPTPLLKTLVTGCGLVEGPRVDEDNHLYFSDVLKGGVYRRAPSGEVETVIPKRRGVGGIALHEAGGVVVSGRNICHVRGGETRIVFDLDGALGFNDLLTDAEGRVLVGSMHFDPFSTEGPREPGELYRIESDGSAAMLYDDVGMTNGIGLSADGRLLYHNDSARNEVLLHDVEEDGSCRNRRVFARPERGTPDGLAVDAEGGIWIAGHGGGCVTRYTSEGVLDRHLDVPAVFVTSLCFGGPDHRDLYIVTADNSDDKSLRGCIFQTRVDVPGLPAALARV